MAVFDWAGVAILGGILASSLVAPASAGVVAQIDQSRQRMRVFVDGSPAYDWPVSTARRDYVTPNGRLRVGLMAPM